MEEYTKESETEIALTTQVTQVMSLESLKQREADVDSGASLMLE